MKVNSISQNVYPASQHIRMIKDNGGDNSDNTGKGGESEFNTQPSFNGAGWRAFRNLSNYFKESDEVVSQIIQFVGTAAIAPFAILVSPSRGEAKKLPKEEQKEKKMFQALRQPVSAVLAFAFMYPFTKITKNLMNYSAFEKRSKLFNNTILELKDGATGTETKIDFGQLITSKSYLTKKVDKQLKKHGLTEEGISKIQGFDGKIDLVKAKEDFRNSIIKEARDIYGEEIPKEQLEKKVNNTKEFRKFVSGKIAGMMREKELDAKVEEFSKKPDIVIKDIDLVTDKYLGQMKNENKAEFAKLKKDAKLTIVDDFIASWGIKTKKMEAYNKAVNKLAKEKGLEYLKKTEPELFTDPAKRLRNYVENLDKEAQRIFKRKTDLIPLGINIFAFAVSCLVLNWLHPKFANFVDGVKQAKAERKAAHEQQKVEVAA